MRYLQTAAFFIVFLYVSNVAAFAQNSFTYKAESSDTGNNSRESITVVITKVQSGWEVSGQFVSNSIPCTISGSYLVEGRRLRATCTYAANVAPKNNGTPVTGFKFADKDAFQISVGSGGGSTLVAYRDGKKPKSDTGDTKTGECSMVGTWKQSTPGIGETEWTIGAGGDAKESGGNAEGKASIDGRKIHIDWTTPTSYAGYYEWTLNGDCKTGAGDLQFKTPRTDKLRSTVTKIR